MANWESKQQFGTLRRPKILSAVAEVTLFLRRRTFVSWIPQPVVTKSAHRFLKARLMTTPVIGLKSPTFTTRFLPPIVTGFHHKPVVTRLVNTFKPKLGAKTRPC